MCKKIIFKVTEKVSTEIKIREDFSIEYRCEFFAGLPQIMLDRLHAEIWLTGPIISSNSIINILKECEQRAKDIERFIADQTQRLDELDKGFKVIRENYEVIHEEDSV
jgi:hypothetical protein